MDCRGEGMKNSAQAWVAKRNHAPVSIQKTIPEKKSVFEAVRTAMELANWRDYITPNAAISLKPNLGWDKLIPGAISAPWVFEAVISVQHNL